MMERRVLVVDDEEGIRGALEQLLEYEGVTARCVSSASEALKVYPTFNPHVTFLDVKMAGMDGIEALKSIRETDPNAHVIMISGHGTIQTAMEATRLGAYDFLEKPLDTDRVLLALRRVFEKVDLQSENVRLRQTIEDRYRIVGDSSAIKGMLQTVEKVAPTASRVLITGENGSGKELIARAIHNGSPRAARPFIEVNCAAIPSELIESELFGHVKGSFTGAIQDRAGKFELAHEGTLFLDEVGDLSLAAQAKLLRTLQEDVITRIGAPDSVEVDVRVIAATNKLLEQEIAEGRFREDLFYRLNVVPIHVPPLSERRDDIPALVEYFRDDLTSKGKLQAKEFDTGAVEALCRRNWPGNVRELRNAVERLLILSSGESVSKADIDTLGGGIGKGSLADFEGEGTFEQFRQSAEKAFLQAKLEENGWNVSETARRLAMPRSNLYKKIEKYGLERSP